MTVIQNQNDRYLFIFKGPEYRNLGPVPENEWNDYVIQNGRSLELDMQLAYGQELDEEAQAELGLIYER